MLTTAHNYGLYKPTCIIRKLRVAYVPVQYHQSFKTLEYSAIQLMNSSQWKFRFVIGKLSCVPMNVQCTYDKLDCMMALSKEK